MCIPVIVIWDDTILLFKQTNYCQAKNAVRLDKGHLQEAIWGGSNQRGLLCQPSGRGLKSNSWYRGVFRLLLTDVKAMESGDWTLVYYNLMSALTLIKALCLVLYFQVTLAGYKKFLAVEVISGFLTWHQSFHLTFVTLPFPGCPWAPESSWRGAKSHQRSRSKDWGEPEKKYLFIHDGFFHGYFSVLLGRVPVNKITLDIMNLCSIRCRWTANTTLWVGWPSLSSQRQQMQSENTARAPRTMSNWPLVRNLAVTAPKKQLFWKTFIFRSDQRDRRGCWEWYLPSRPTPWKGPQWCWEVNQCLDVKLNCKICHIFRYHLFRFKHTHEGDSLESNGV